MLEIQTLPALTGVRFSLDGRIFSSNQEGVARIEAEAQGKHVLRLVDETFLGPRVTATFFRWCCAVSGPFNSEIILRDIEADPSRALLQVGFKVSYLVSPIFVDLGLNPIDPERVTAFTLRNAIGERIESDQVQPMWLLGGRQVPFYKQLVHKEILYSVESVIVDGSNVVNRAQQRFFPSQDREWRIELLFYSARFVSQDALFGIPIGSAIRIEYPDGRQEFHSLDPSGQLTLPSLPRGGYKVRVEGVPGFSFTLPVALSRDQDVVLRVVTYADIGVVVGLTALIVVGLLINGRPQLLSAVNNTGPKFRFVPSKIRTGWGRNLDRQQAVILAGIVLCLALLAYVVLQFTVRDPLAMWIVTLG